MPKVINTRKQRAEKLLRNLENGPLFGSLEFTEQKAREQYQLWVKTWILPETVQLIPELRKSEKAKNDRQNH